MSRGGNAVDGAMAANAVLGVVLPDTCGPGGDLFAIVHRPGDSEPIALNASGRAGSGATASTLRSRGLSEIPPRSRWTVTVPGCVDGWQTLHEREGSKSLPEVLAPAIDLADNGFPVSLELAESLHRLQDVIGEEPSAEPLYPGGLPPQQGARLRRRKLAETLTAIASNGREAFYDGPVGRAITTATGGLIDRGDLQRDQAEWVRPISIDVFGRTGWTIPPNSQAYLTLATLWMFEQLAPAQQPGSIEYQHALIEAYRAVAWERDDFVCEPSFAPEPADSLVATRRLTDRMRSIDLRKTARWPSPRPAPGGTAFLCTKDAAGIGVALIQSNFHGIGSGISAGDTGVFLQDRGAGFNLIEGHPNEMQPGKRPLHTLSPTLWTTDDGRLAAVIGTRGGQYQPQILAQVIADLFFAGMPPLDAQAAPRWLVDGWNGGERHVVRLEGEFPPGVAPGLADRGHDVVVEPAHQTGWGPVSIVTAEGGEVVGSADPRVSTASVAVG